MNASMAVRSNKLTNQKLDDQLADKFITIQSLNVPTDNENTHDLSQKRRDSNVLVKRPSISSRTAPIKLKASSNKRYSIDVKRGVRKKSPSRLIIATTQTKPQRNTVKFEDTYHKEFDQDAPLNDTIKTAVELLNGDSDTKVDEPFKNTIKLLEDTDTLEEFIEEPTSDHQETFDLLQKIRVSAAASNVGPLPLSLQACRFELPHDLKVLETLTPLEYLSNYCRLSLHRQCQFKHMYDLRRHISYNFDLFDLQSAMKSLHKENLTKQNFNDICELIGLKNEKYAFDFNTFAGILALSERILFHSNELYAEYNKYYTPKQILEQCDFDSLQRKLDGLNISENMKQLLYKL